MKRTHLLAAMAVVLLAALEAAAAKQFWQRSATISIPADLVKAVAQHESGWQSNAVSCAGAYGAYEVGHQTVHDEFNDGDSSMYANPDYVANVRYWMARY